MLNIESSNEHTIQQFHSLLPRRIRERGKQIPNTVLLTALFTVAKRWSQSKMSSNSWVAEQNDCELASIHMYTHSCIVLYFCVAMEYYAALKGDYNVSYIMDKSWKRIIWNGV